MRKTLYAICLLGLTFPLLGCGAPAGDAAVRLVLANVHVEGYPTARGIRFFEERLRQDPRLARLAPDLQLGGVLGNEKEVLEKLGFGAVQMATTSVAPLAEFSEQIGVLTLPYLFRDAEHMWTVLDGEIGQELLASLESSGFVGLAFYDAGARSFYNRQRPVRSLADLEGLKIRVQKSEIMREMVEALGATPVAIGFKEVYTNLHTGAIDGAENNVPSYRSERHFEVATYYSYDRHSMIPDLLMVGKSTWDALSSVEQEALREAARASAEAQRGFWREYVDEALEAVREAGCEVNEIDDVAAFQDAVAPLYEKHGERWGTLVERIRAVATVDPHAQVKRMGRGVNVIGYDPIWKSFEQRRFQEKHFQKIREGGFQTVRINLHAFQHMAADGRLEEAWLKTLDWAVENALANDLMVILDLHNFTDFAKDPVGLKPKFLDFWRQIAPRYKDASSNLIFEILNEPNGELTAELWNQYLREALAIVRQTNPGRTVILGPPSWNSFEHLDELDLPEDDRNLVVTFHYYEPFDFTHQGAPWVDFTRELSGITWGSDEEKRKVEEDFAVVDAWSKAHRRPIFLGELGAYDKGDMASRARYTAHVARTAESLGFAWAYWQFDSDFIVYDVDADGWVEPIWKALVP